MSGVQGVAIFHGLLVIILGVGTYVMLNAAQSQKSTQSQARGKIEEK
jgi:hypothetical protein